jgi:putative acetyltransferase
MKRAPQVRAMRPDDIDAVIDVFRASVRLVASRDYTPEQVMSWAPNEIDAAAWGKRYDTRQAWVAEIEGAVAGFIELQSHGHLDMLYVHPAHQRQGVAGALLQQLEAAARELGIGRLNTEASITARPFFERRGFRLIASQTVVLRGQELVNFRMEKRLR